MSHPISLRGDFNAPALRRLARASDEANQARRLLALAAIYAGDSRTAAGRSAGWGSRSCATGWCASTPTGRLA